MTANTTPAEIPAKGTTYTSAQHPGETLRVTKVVPACVSEYDRVEIHATTGTKTWELPPVVFAHMISAEGWEVVA